MSNLGKFWTLLIGLETTKDLSARGDSSSLGGEISGKIRSSWSQSIKERQVLTSDLFFRLLRIYIGNSNNVHIFEICQTFWAFLGDKRK